ncbi:uncharacterized protein F58A4.6 [Cylas formicarius]|uniref:uncharacterized protein F58A4.6 n=1 Tax=Cylas formicarius TaxID=197179 RepID=UPI00295897C8|nr:uncharacterized protein F58A4.6 [Cylas formicarius]
MKIVLKSYDNYTYDQIKLDYEEFQSSICEVVSSTAKPKTRWKLDCTFVYYLLRELKFSVMYRNHFLNCWSQYVGRLIVILEPTTVDLIDYKWNYRLYCLVREKCELDHALSWLSTLGGAFSALGDYFERCAETAGKISVNQLRLALRLGDASIVARCRLYLSLSLIQMKRFKAARRIILAEYESAKSQVVKDERLLRMCQGIWAKLKYEMEMAKNVRKSEGQ